MIKRLLFLVTLALVSLLFLWFGYNKFLIVRTIPNVSISYFNDPSGNRKIDIKGMPISKNGAIFFEDKNRYELKIYDNTSLLCMPKSADPDIRLDFSKYLGTYSYYAQRTNDGYLIPKIIESQKKSPLQIQILGAETPGQSKSINAELVVIYGCIK